MTSNSNIDNTSIDLTVSAIIERDNRFLCIEEHSSFGIVVNVPGGHIEPGETPEQAIVREVMEETRWQFAPRGFVGAYLWHDQLRQQQLMRLIYFGRVLHESTERELDNVIVAVRWRSRDASAADAQRLRAPVVLTAIDDYLLGRRARLCVNSLSDQGRILETVQAHVHML